MYFTIKSQFRQLPQKISPEGIVTFRPSIRTRPLWRSFFSSRIMALRSVDM